MNTFDKKEVEKFSKLANEWWNPNGKFKPLHLFNPTRIGFIRDKLISHFNLNPNDPEPLKKISILDIGCGNGLFASLFLDHVDVGLDLDYRNMQIENSFRKD